MSVVEWAASAARGEAHEYFRGELAKTRKDLNMRGVANPIARANCDNANEAWRLYERGVVTLIQQRIGPRAFSYIAVRL